MPYFVYFLKSRKNGKYYIGSSKNVQHRLNQHNQGYSKSTKSGIPWELVRVEEYSTLKEARKREADIKRMKSKIWIDELLANAGSNK